MKSKRLGRRGLLKGGAALVGGLAMGGLRPASAQESGSKLIHDANIRPLGEVPRFERKIVRGAFGGSKRNGLTPLQELQRISTPADLHLQGNHANGPNPASEPRQIRQ